MTFGDFPALSESHGHQADEEFRFPGAQGTETGAPPAESAYVSAGGGGEGTRTRALPPERTSLFIWQIVISFGVKEEETLLCFALRFLSLWSINR